MKLCLAWILAVVPSLGLIGSDSVVLALDAAEEFENEETFDYSLSENENDLMDLMDELDEEEWDELDLDEDEDEQRQLMGYYYGYGALTWRRFAFAL